MTLLIRGCMKVLGSPCMQTAVATVTIVAVATVTIVTVATIATVTIVEVTYHQTTDPSRQPAYPTRVCTAKKPVTPFLESSSHAESSHRHV